MPTLFSRSRTNSSPNKKLSPTNDNYKLTSDEFGRVSSRLSTRGIGNSPVSKKDKKRDRDDRPRPRTASSARDRPDTGSYLADSIPDGSFLPLCLERPYDESGLQRPIEQSYGYLSYERHVVLGLEQLTRLVDVVTTELESRGGLTTPFIFSSLALDISAPAIKRLIQTFLATCHKPGAADAERRWRDEAKFAGPYELGMCLRWGLARVVRSVGGQDVRGLISWDHYVQFRDSEAALQYPPSHFSTFLPGLAQPLQSILLSLFSLLIRMTAHSASSGHTPPTLSPLFGPLLFGLGPPTLAFHHTYIHYLWATNATEHLILAFIRWQDAPRTVLSSTDFNSGVVHGSATSLGVPARLKDWIRGYPIMLPFLKDTNKHTKPQARKGARTVRIVSVRRNVRMYSSDLVKTAASWGQRPKPGFTSNERGFAMSKEWERIAPTALKLSPRYSDAYKKRMDMPPHFHPDLGPGVIPMESASSSTSSRTSTEDEDPFGLGIGLLGVRQGEDRFRSLTDLKWGEFETMGFAGLGTDEKKLQFDLTEGARTARAAKRATLSWNDFSNSGFSRNDAPLNATLQFSTPISTTISSWPSHNAEISKKMKKAQRALPPFGWDTEPIIGTEEMVEEAFVDVFCDLVYGGGWMDLERVEEHDRECNWALVEFKALGSQRNSAIAGSDPRTATSLLLFEEFVPLEYRQQLAEGVTNRRRLPSLFSPSSKSKQWKPALTLNGRPYVVGHVPHIPSYREVEFEGLLRGTGDTKVISLGSRTSVRGQPAGLTAPSVIAITSDRDSTPQPLEKSRSRDENTVTNNNKGSNGEPQPQPHSESVMSASAKRLSRFKLPGGIPVPSPGGGRKTGMVPSEYSTVEFETRVASYSDDEYQPDDLGQRQATDAEKRARRESRDDSWMEILVATQDRRIGSQEAEFRRNGKSGRSDPESASLEVAKALAAVLDQKPLSEDEADLERLHDADVVDEVQLIPRRMAVYDGDYFSNLPHQEPVYGQESEPSQEDEPGHEEPEEGEEEEEEEEEGEEEEEEEEEAATTPSGVSYLQQQKANRRLGYFDLHPERRQATAQDDDHARLPQSADEAGDTGVYPPLVDNYVAPLVPRKVVNPTLLTDYELPSTFSAMNDDSEFDRTEDRRSNPEKGRAPTVDSYNSPAGTSPNSNGNGIGSDTDDGTSKLHTPSKTAALIEMYRERERGTPTKSIPAVSQPSRLPVRALPTPPKEPVLLPPKTSPVSVQPPILPSISPEPQLMDLPQVPVDDNGRSSPARYVHGAPLHNVLEEEEEEP